MSLRLAKSALIGILILSYPAIVYYLLSHDLPWLGASVVIVIILFKLKHRTDRVLWAGALLLVTASIAYFLGPAFISKVVPILIHLTLFIVFWQSLKTSPLITQFARLDFPELPPGIADYCRSLTKVWTCFFAINAILCLWLATTNNNEFWAIYNGLIIYILIAVLVIGEYLWRKIQFPGLEVPSLSQSIQNIIEKGPQIWSKTDEHVDHSR